MLFEFISLVYGQLIIRLPGPGCQISSADEGFRFQACGLSWATALNRAHNSPMRRRCGSDVSPAAILSACSNIGYTYAGRSRWILISTGPAISNLSLAPFGSGTDSSCLGQSSLPPAARTLVRVRHASAPAISTVSTRPPAMSRQAWLTSDWGTLPPTLLYQLSACDARMRSATSRPGFRYRHDSRLTMRTESTASRMRGSAAARAARSIRSMGVTEGSSSYWLTWP